MATTSHASAPVAVRSSWISVAWWVSLLLLHVANTLYYLGFAVFYKYLGYTNLDFQLTMYSIGISSSEYGGIAVTHGVIFIIHAIYILVMMGSSITARRFVFRPSASLSSALTEIARYCQRRVQVLDATEPAQHKRSSLGSIRDVVFRSTRRSVDFVFGRDGLLSVDSVYFDDLHVIREFFETALQSYQAYRMTQLLPRLGLIRVYVALLVANCWSVPILHRVYRYHRRKRRLLSLLCDAVLDTISSMGITLVIFVTYAPQYTDPRFGFPFTNWFNDEWFTSVVQEFQMMLVVSWGDMASRLVFALGLIQCMDTIKAMLEPADVQLDVQIYPATTTAVVPSPPGAGEGPSGSLVPKQGGLARVSWWNRLRWVKSFILHNVGPWVFVVWGVVILSIHAYADSHASSEPCKLDLRPWLRSKPACSLVEIDCHSQGVSGSEASLRSAWLRFDPSLTAHLTIRHCPELEIPPLIGQYNDLVSMKVYNSNVVSWSESAAISARDHGDFRSMYFVRTNFANNVIPLGLRTTEFPQSFRSFVAVVTNLESLPDDLDTVWPPNLALVIEYSEFTAVPDVIIRLQPTLLSLSKNTISSVPAGIFEIPALGSLLLCYTRVEEMPRVVPNPSANLYVIVMDGTPVSTLWGWMDSIIERSLQYRKQLFNMHGTRYCAERNNIEAGVISTFSKVDQDKPTSLARVMDVSTAERLAYSKEAVNCELDLSFFFPLPLEDAVSALPRGD